MKNQHISHSFEHQSSSLCPHSKKKLAIQMILKQTMYGIDQKSTCLIIVGSQVEKFAQKRQF
jgi:hypothetical protein